VVCSIIQQNYFQSLECADTDYCSRDNSLQTVVAYSS